MKCMASGVMALALGLALLAGMSAAQTSATEVQPNTLTRVKVPKDVTFHQVACTMPTRVTTRMYITGCFGDNVEVFIERKEIDPDTAKVRARLNGTNPLYDYILPSVETMYVGLRVTTGTTELHKQMNGAFDIFIGTNETVEAAVPKVPRAAPKVTISSNSETATLSWEWNENDVGKIYRRDVPRAGLNVSAWMPPPSFFLTGCSAEYWMEVDDEATSRITRSNPSGTWMGTTRVPRIVEDNVTFVVITTRHNAANSFSSAYPIIGLNSAPASRLSLLLIALVFAAFLLF